MSQFKLTINKKTISSGFQKHWQQLTVVLRKC